MYRKSQASTNVLVVNQESFLIIRHAVWNNPKQKTRTKLNLNLEKELQDNDLFVRPTYGLYTFEGSVLPYKAVDTVDRARR